MQEHTVLDVVRLVLHREETQFQSERLLQQSACAGVAFVDHHLASGFGERL